MTKVCDCEIYCKDIENCRYTEEMLILGDFSKIEEPNPEFEKLWKEKVSLLQSSLKP
jgi:hypothetical protein